MPFLRILAIFLMLSVCSACAPSFKKLNLNPVPYDKADAKKSLLSILLEAKFPYGRSIHRNLSENGYKFVGVKSFNNQDVFFMYEHDPENVPESKFIQAAAGKYTILRVSVKDGARIESVTYIAPGTGYTEPRLNFNDSMQVSTFQLNKDPTETNMTYSTQFFDCEYNAQKKNCWGGGLAFNSDKDAENFISAMLSIWPNIKYE